MNINFMFSMASITPGNYTSAQIQQFGLDPNNTTATQNGYRLVNDGRGGRNVQLADKSSVTPFSNGGATRSALSDGGLGSMGGSFDDIVKHAIDMSRQAVQPAVDQLRSSVDTTKQFYNNASQRVTGNIAPLQDRYNNLINSIKGNQQVAENRQTTTTNNELGRRGILSNSGVGEQELTNAVNPITQQYTGMVKDTGSQQEQDIKALQDQAAGLLDQGNVSSQNIQSQIAQLLSSAAQTGQTQGQSLYESQVQQALQQKQLEQAAQQAAIENAYKNAQLAQQGAQFGQTQSQNASQFGQNIALQKQQAASQLAQLAQDNYFKNQGINIQGGQLKLGQDQLALQKAINNPVPLQNIFGGTKNVQSTNQTPIKPKSSPSGRVLGTTTNRGTSFGAGSNGKGIAANTILNGLRNFKV